MKANEARRKLGEVLDGVMANNDKVIIERYGRPIAVIVPVEVYRQWERARKEAFDNIRKVSERVNMDPDEADKLVAEAVRWVRGNKNVQD